VRAQDGALRPGHGRDRPSARGILGVVVYARDARPSPFILNDPKSVCNRAAFTVTRVLIMNLNAS
jgi:hypothetical protein